MIIEAAAAMEQKPISTLIYFERRRFEIIVLMMIAP
jgi:hypothetical protein